MNFFTVNFSQNNSSNFLSNYYVFSFTTIIVGVPEDLVNYFHFVAEEVRAGLAAVGLRSLNDLIGRADLLRQRQRPLAKTTGLDLSFLTTYAGETGSSNARLAQDVHDNGPQLDDEILADPAVMEAINTEGSVTRDYAIVNVDRSALGRVAGAIAKPYGDNRFKGTVELNLKGSAGQSFACFLVEGMKVHLTGEANDYVGKGMAGGDVTIVPPPASPFQPETASIVGNTCLYGATGGKLFVLGRAGERFAVRNSRAEAVVEGTGDHCCEYMTGGVVVALGPVGRNVAAGMTGGLGYFYDEDGTFPELVNGEIVAIQKVQTRAGEAQLKGLIEGHVARTGSAKGAALLADWSSAVQKFWQLVPPSEANSPQASKTADDAVAEGGAAEGSAAQRSAVAASA